MDELYSQTLNSIPSEEHIEVRAPGREGWHPCEKSHRSPLPGYTHSSTPVSAFRPTEHSAWRSWKVSSMPNTQLLIGTQDLSIGQNPQFTGLGKPAVRMILGTYPSEPVHFLPSSGPKSGPDRWIT